MDLHQVSKIRISCPRGLSAYLEREVGELGFPIEAADATGVEIAGTLTDCMRLNLFLRSATALLYLVDEFTCSTPDEMYGRLVSLPWEELISPEEYVSIVSTVDTPAITDSRFASRRAKDAIVDRIADRRGRRPNSGPDRENVVVNIYWRGQDCRVYVNTTGRKLADRNYRKMPHKAPMAETLAAAVIMETGYDGSQPLVNPMCGSGTLAIEAALLATGRPPGLLRSNFAFMHLLGYDPAAWQAIRAEARKVRRPGTPAPIIATDIDDRAIRAAEQNAKTAGVDQLIRFQVCDFADTLIPPEKGIVILNPEYGERLGDERTLEGTYARIGDFFKQRCAGWTGYVFTGNPKLAKKIGLKTSRRVPFFNANIECRLLKFEMYEGSRRKPRP
ncbi:MAG TPA: class I SAM-dependent RNA methyltransferase [Phycisphaerae bacterium]|nr:class I SAM-dependent RNA methyltransferase [Phycisphaerae bacterium]HOJ76180.1 class I SAM-dependent RNA methyltransferase [Phycisphaerae bacterium]HOM53530.1 class I SAM-dependent RNA methyltransferase [Phycisphaerae bacterium]HOQ86627.1 class I SAM-dependent RNA methyltransferase [Phycisphaerae bacterium]HPP28805.1 class I SAM-dependent RNA methyltransferase [Phycisphaerae bacterium]